MKITHLLKEREERRLDVLPDDRAGLENLAAFLIRTLIQKGKKEDLILLLKRYR